MHTFFATLYVYYRQIIIIADDRFFGACKKNIFEYHFDMQMKRLI